jgi:hypothetical protein
MKIHHKIKHRHIFLISSVSITCPTHLIILDLIALIILGDDPGYPARGENFLFATASRPALMPKHTPIGNIGGSFQCGKSAGA